jgi:hypothetical protein
MTAVDPAQVASLNYLAWPLGGKAFLLALSGVVEIDFPGQPGTDWHRDETSAEHAQ